jgi:hypothetical protein
MLALAIVVAIAEGQARRPVVHAVLLRAVAARLEIVALAVRLRLPVVGLAVIIAEAAALGLLGIGLRRRIERRRRTFGGRGETVEHAAVVFLFLLDLDFAGGAALGGELGSLRGRDQAEVMLCVLEVVFRRHGIAAGVRVAGELQIFFGDVMRVAANFHVGAVGFIGAREGVGAAPVV